MVCRGHISRPLDGVSGIGNILLGHMPMVVYTKYIFNIKDLGKHGGSRLTWLILIGVRTAAHLTTQQSRKFHTGKYRIYRIWRRSKAPTKSTILG